MQWLLKSKLKKEREDQDVKEANHPEISMERKRDIYVLDIYIAKE